MANLNFNKICHDVCCIFKTTPMHHSICLADATEWKQKKYGKQISKYNFTTDIATCLDACTAVFVSGRCAQEFRCRRIVNSTFRLSSSVSSVSTASNHRMQVHCTGVIKPPDHSRKLASTVIFTILIRPNSVLLIA
jgi:hypothetical protein